ncbi:MAGUK p55 subfamily member 6-like protein [Dinothrombium tinctorium]|uniref:MAGUK p55 subfamily member 6-like protein n=1 Tax=Dinothrombium tinctorium TaxID=1965070 RepID=A0A443QLW4_9ACAR|nr:MAGUK p55 subfamily member 6-like protein [Dinothrombium tinctorium]
MWVQLRAKLVTSRGMDFWESGENKPAVAPSGYTYRATDSFPPLLIFFLSACTAAFDALRASIEALDERVPDARNTDLVFLKGLIDSPVMNSLLKVQETLEENTAYGQLSPVIETDSISLANDVKEICSLLSSRDWKARELKEILSNPHIEALMETHDLVANKRYDDHEASEESYEMDVLNDNKILADHGISQAIRIVGIRKKGDEPLGMTVTIEDDHIVIARILAGGLVDQQGLLHVGDIILEVNGVEVHTPEELNEQLRHSKGSVTFKISPSFHEPLVTTPCYMRALYSYDPSEDSLLPCRELGLSFNQGDILEVLNQKDPNWWQARNISTGNTTTGLIPSQELEERRRAFVRPEFDYATKTSICGTRVTKKKKKEMYKIHANTEFDKAELMLYEEVCRMPPFERKTLVLLGAQGVGRRTLKTRLLNYDPERFASPLPHTSRPIREGEDDGKVYHFVKREIMEADIADNKYLEYGEYQGHLYGTKLDSIRAVIRSGKMCVIDCNPQCMKLLKTAEFMPFVVFIAAPPIDQLRFMHEWGRHHGFGGRTYTFDRALGRQSRRARTLQSLASFYEDEDLQATIDESQRLQRMYEKSFDLLIVNNNFEKTFEQLREALDAMTIEPQWVPISWVYSE